MCLDDDVRSGRIRKYCWPNHRTAIRSSRGWPASVRSFLTITLLVSAVFSSGCHHRFAARLTASLILCGTGTFPSHVQGRVVGFTEFQFRLEHMGRFWDSGCLEFTLCECPMFLQLARPTLFSMKNRHGDRDCGN